MEKMIYAKLLRVNSQMVRKMAMESWIGRMAINIMDIGKITSGVEKEQCYLMKKVATKFTKESI